NVIAFLQAKGITRLDALLISHSDSDHSGGVTDIAEAYQPSQIVIDHQEKIVAGDFTFYDLNELKTEDENQSSLVLYTEVNGIRYLCMGDGDEVTEEAIRRKYLDLGADVLMLAHHGSATGNSERFLDHVQPALGIISCGAYGLYHHPSPIVIQRLLKRHIPYVLTREQGDITVFAIGPFNVLVTSHPTIGLIARGGL
ncbi:MBL fold metallo-hydrolase, partial [Galactobacillus timonensis]|uniref:ComEC/Rec2 family competence protein n=1 Tax=Galactobacillus timonensis TaxID=2041840 RepID=UPI0024096875